MKKYVAMKYAAAILLAALIVLPGLAQAPKGNAKGNGKQAAPEQADESSTIRLDVTRVPLLFTVSDKKGRFITGLTRDEFEILENKKAQKISEFTAETDLPLRMA